MSKKSKAKYKSFVKERKALAQSQSVGALISKLRKYHSELSIKNNTDIYRSSSILSIDKQIKNKH